MRDKIIAYIVALVILALAIGGVLYTTGCFDSKEMRSHMSGGEDTLIVVEGEVAMPHNSVIVSDRFVGKINKDSSVIAIGTDGEAYVVQNGVVLASDLVIDADQDSYSVRRLSDERKSVSTE